MLLSNKLLDLSNHGYSVELIPKENFLIVKVVFGKLSATSGIKYCEVDNFLAVTIDALTEKISKQS